MNTLDTESLAFLDRMALEEKVKGSRIAGVRTVLVILSSMGMVYDRESLRQKIRAAYTGATVFFRTTEGYPVGPAAPGKVDLMIDFTSPGAHQGFLYARKLRRMARVVVGRNVGLFRKRLYDHVVDETDRADSLPKNNLDRERIVQREVLAAVGIAMEQTGELPPDQGKSIALSLPPFSKL